MKCVRYKFGFAHGDSKWEYFTVHDETTKEDVEESIDSKVHELFYDQSDKFRGYEWDFIPFTTEYIEKEIKQLETQKAWCDEGIKRYKEELKKVK